MIKQNAIPYLKVVGSPKDMGRKHGEVFAKEIKQLYIDRLNILLEGSGKVSISDIEKIARSLWRKVERFDEKIAEEISETAYACELLTWQMIIAGGYSDVKDLLSPRSISDFHECSIAINPKQGYIAGTWDSHPSAKNALILFERHPINAPATLALTTAGWPCQQGINSSGVGFAITNLTPINVNKTNLIYIAANASLGYSDSVKSIVEKFKNIKFCSGHSYVVLDSMQGAIIETTSEKVHVMNVNRLETKTNHYWQGDGAIDDNSSYPYLCGSKQRQMELYKIIQNVSDSDTFASCLANSKYVTRNRDKESVLTCAYFFISIKERSIWCSKGPASLTQEKNSILKKSLI